jgi:hypothetical protein
MRIENQVKVTGIKRSKGEFEGVKYDSSKFYVETDLDDRSGNAKGVSTAEYGMGDSTVFDKYSHLPLPFMGKASFELVTGGKGQSKLVLVELVPVDMVKEGTKKP